MSNNRTGIFPNIDNDSLSSQRTDPRRVSIFSAEQGNWVKKSIEVENEINIMLEKQKTLYEIYEYARCERMRIAQELETDNVVNFGLIRKRDGKDLYTPQQFAGAKGNPENLKKMKAILLNQNLIKTEMQDDLEVAQKLARDQIYIKFNPDLIVTEHVALPKTETDLKVRMYTSSNRESGIETNDTFIRVEWGMMDEEIYVSKLNKLDLQRKEFMNNECRGDEALYKLGLLSYDLSRLMLLQRGSSAVNGWIIRSMAKEKGFAVGVMSVKELPFDIYAEIQTNREQYAREFAESLKKEFNLVTNSEGSMRKNF